MVGTCLPSCPLPFPCQATPTIPMPEGNPGLPQAKALLPVEPGRAESRIPGAWPAAIKPVVGTRGRYMWGHLCFSKPAAARASSQPTSLLKSRRHCSLEKNPSNPLPRRGQPEGRGWVRTGPVPARGRGLRLPPAGLCSVCGCGLCARWAACTCARTRG